MSFLDQNLLPGEEIIYRTKKHKIIFLIPVLLVIFTIFCLFHSNPFVVKAAFLPAIAALITGVNQYLTYITSEFAVTNKRIRMREGFFIRHTNETRLATIADVGVNQSLIGQLLDYGTVFINAFGGKEDPFSLIAAPNEFQKQLQAQLGQIDPTQARNR